MGLVRGASICGTVDFILERYGHAELTRVLAALPPETRRAIGDGGAALLPSGWYECAALTELTEQMDLLLGRGDLVLARAVGKQIAFDDVNRFFKWLLRLGGPRVLFARAESVWKNYHNVGRYVAEQVDAEHAVIRIDDWDSAHPVMCKRVEGWIERALELTLGEAVVPTIRETQHLACDPGVPARAFCRFVAEWGPGPREARS